MDEWVCHNFLLAGSHNFHFGRILMGVSEPCGPMLGANIGDHGPLPNCTKLLVISLLRFWCFAFFLVASRERAFAFGDGHQGWIKLDKSGIHGRVVNVAA